MAGTDLLRALDKRYRAYFAHRAPVTFAVATHDSFDTFGTGEPAFTITVADVGAKALGSLDQLQVAVAYLRGNLDVEGDLTVGDSGDAEVLPDIHPIAWLAGSPPDSCRARPSTTAAPSRPTTTASPTSS